VCLLSELHFSPSRSPARAPATENLNDPGGNPAGWWGVYSYAACLFASDNSTTQLMVGWSTAISGNGDTIVLGAPGWVGGPNGVAYVFTKPASAASRYRGVVAWRQP
jgi:hypothetical protein